MKSPEEYRVPLEKLRKVCNGEEELGFCKTSLDVPMLDGVIGQERAVRAMQFGLAMDADGYNIFVVGEQGTGKTTYVKTVVTQIAEKGKVPEDWCYVNNFGEWDKPIAVSLPSGMGRIFQKDMEVLVMELREAIPKAFESSDYEQKREAIARMVQKKMEELYHSIEQSAFEAGFGVKQVQERILFIPLRYGRPMIPEEMEKLTPEELKVIDENKIKLEKIMDRILQEGLQIEEQADEKLYELDLHTATAAAGPLVNKLKEKYEPVPKVVEYLGKVLKDIGENPSIFGVAEPAGNRPRVVIPHEDMEPGEGDEPGILKTALFAPQEEMDPLARYRVNLFTNHEKSAGAPVVIECNPYYYNLFGKIEYRSQLLSMSTDFTMVKAGAIHMANGGYLILQAKDVLTDPFAWDALKKAIKYRQAVVENIGEQYRFVPTVTLKPEPIPLSVKIILIGSPLYYLIYSLDEDFRKFFKVKVDFDDEMDRNRENIHEYASFISSVCRQEKLRHFTRTAIAKVVEYGSRLAGDQKKLSTQFNEISDLACEAELFAKTEGSEYVESSHVERAIRDQKYRLNMLEEKIQEQMLQDKLVIDTEGSVTGQLNGLFIIESAGYSFGLPARITATTYAGRGGVINIERETEMSGNIHSKGVLTLAGYLGGKLAQQRPMGFTAQVTFEQVYEGVEGDSASSAELYAILSSLSGVPLKQNMAVTGSVDQLGGIQPIGGVTQKIEGFFDICKGKGLTGEQGVIIPARNIDNLMLKEEVLEAVGKNLFHIYGIRRIEEGIELLTGVEAGEADGDGKYPEGSIFFLADHKLQEYNRVLEPGNNSNNNGNES